MREALSFFLRARAWSAEQFDASFDVKLSWWMSLGDIDAVKNDRCGATRARVLVPRLRACSYSAPRMEEPASRTRASFDMRHDRTCPCLMLQRGFLEAATNRCPQRPRCRPAAHGDRVSTETRGADERVRVVRASANEHQNAPTCGPGHFAASPNAADCRRRRLPSSPLPLRALCLSARCRCTT